MFKVYTLSSPYQRSEGRIGSYLVTDVPDDYKSDIEWPSAASFPVSMRFDQPTQKRRAYEYCDYLNRGIVVQAPIGLEEKV